MSQSLPDNLDFATSLDKIARTVTANGTSVDTGQDHFARMSQLDLGAWTDGTHKFTWQESPNGTDWTTLTAAQLDDIGGVLDSVDLNSVNVVDATGDDTIIEMGLLVTERFVRVVQTVTGGPATGLVSGVIITSGLKRYAGGDGQPMSPTGFQRTQPTI